MKKKDLLPHAVQTQQVDRVKKRLDVVFEVSQKITATLRLKEVLDRIIKLAIETVEADSGSLMLLDEKTNRLKIKSAVGLSKKLMKSVSLEVGERIAGWVARHKKPLLLLDGLTQYPEFSHLKSRRNIASSISLPLRMGHQLLGILNINRTVKSRRPPFTNGTLELLQTLANQATIAINNARLHEQVRQQNLKLQRINRTKTELMTHVTHELRTPLTAIRGHTSNILAGMLGKLTPAQQERLQKIEKLCSRQSGLVNQLLDISQFASGSLMLKRESVSLKSLLEETRLSLGPLPEEKHLTIEDKLPDNLPTLWAESKRLERVFTNLLSNAVKYTPAEGKITISAHRKSNYIQVDISDTGIGIPKNSLPYIFDEFYQADTKINCEVPGNGLGLALVKYIIEAHKGKIWVKSTPDKGSTFSFRLPIDPRLLEAKK